MEKKSLSLGAVFIFGIIIFLISLKNIGYVFTGDAVNLSDLSKNEIKVGKAVEVELYYCIDWYAELTVSNKRGRKVTQHAIGVLEDGTLVSVCVRKATGQYYKIDDFINASYKYLSGETDIPPEPMVLKGSVVKIDPEIRGYYDSAIWMLGYDSGDVIYFDVDTTQKRIYFVFVFVAGLAMIIVPVIAFVVEYNDMKRKRIERLNDIPQNYNNNDNDDPIFNSKFYETHKTNIDNQSTDNNVVKDDVFENNAVEDTNYCDNVSDNSFDENDEALDGNGTMSYSGKFKLKDE